MLIYRDKFIELEVDVNMEAVYTWGSWPDPDCKEKFPVLHHVWLDFPNGHRVDIIRGIDEETEHRISRLIESECVRESMIDQKFLDIVERLKAAREGEDQ